MNITMNSESESSGSSDDFDLDENILDEFKTVIEGFEPAIEEIGERIQKIQNTLENHEANWFTQEVQPISPGLVQFWKFYNLSGSLEFKTLLSKILEIAKTDLEKRTITFREDVNFFEGFKNGGTIFDFIPYLVQSIKFLG